MNNNEQEIIFRFAQNQTSISAEKIYSLLLAPTYNGASDQTLIAKSANLIDESQNEQFNVISKLVDVLTRSGITINFLFKY